jgi:hypothetical protein
VVVFIYDTALVRSLCHRIAAEQDPGAIEDLINLLHAAINESDEEVRLRLKFLRKKHAFALKEHGLRALKHRIWSFLVHVVAK